jgi:hypothetical protein
VWMGRIPCAPCATPSRDPSGCCCGCCAVCRKVAIPITDVTDLQVSRHSLVKNGRVQHLTDRRTALNSAANHIAPTTLTVTTNGAALAAAVAVAVPTAALTSSTAIDSVSQLPRLPGVASGGSSSSLPMSSSAAGVAASPLSGAAESKTAEGDVRRTGTGAGAGIAAENSAAAVSVGSDVDDDADGWDTELPGGEDCCACCRLCTASRALKEARTAQYDKRNTAHDIVLVVRGGHR